MRGVVAIFVLVAMLLNSGCAIYEKEVSNRGGYLDAVLDDHWMKADSKGMRALRAFAIQVSLARIASVSAKNDSDRQLLAIRIGALTKRFLPIYACAFDRNPLGVSGAENDPCFYYDSAMLDYSTGLFDLAMVALPVEDAKKLVNSVTGAVINPVNILDLLNSLLQIGKDALKYGRVVGALYRDTVELEVQLWLATPAIDNRPPPYLVTDAHVAALREIYARRNDDMPAWLAAMAALRGQGLEPMPQPRFFAELGGLMKYICNLITRDSAALQACKAGLPTTIRAPVAVLSPVSSADIGNPVRPTGAGQSGPAADAGKSRRPAQSADNSGGQTERPQLMASPMTAIEKNVTVADGMKFQSALCVTPSNTFDASTRAQLKVFNAAFLYPTDSNAVGQIVTNADLQHLRAALRQFPDCGDAGFRNGFEAGLFARFGLAEMRAKLAAAGISLPSAPGTRVIDDATRQAIGKLATKLGLTGDEITREFYTKMTAER